MSTSGSSCWQPSTVAAAVRVHLVQSSTRTTGVPSSLASSAVLNVPRASIPSNRPRLPSTTATSAPAVAEAKESRTAVRGT